MVIIRKKTPKELDAQLKRVETFLGVSIPKNDRDEILLRRVDELATEYSRFYLSYFSTLQLESRLLHFPGLPKELLKGQERPVIAKLLSATRSCAFKITFSDNTKRVIKALESRQESVIAEIVSGLGIGPKQYPTEEGFLHEEFIEGTPLLMLEDKTCTPEFMESLGGKFAEALKKLHQHNILVNDQILADDFGKSHMIIDNKGDVRFVDFGASINMAHFPELSNDDVVSIMRTDPFMMFSLHGFLGASEKEMAQKIAGYREHVLGAIKTKADLVGMKDFQMLGEGLLFLQGRLPHVGFFAQGVRKGFAR